eukprot:TRINITY_DN27535_c1_g1_i3.p1 TRINITY_DN27535_c1_g1~~TRINITY_DN27535_c1_g1_i3.p1  ORF type:complete len:148 (+),score=21.52 TRINITY_DN27535_c1_g1_i3:68-445(+)
MDNGLYSMTFPSASSPLSIALSLFSSSLPLLIYSPLFVHVLFCHICPHPLSIPCLPFPILFSSLSQTLSFPLHFIILYPFFPLLVATHCIGLILSDEIKLMGVHSKMGFQHMIIGEMNGEGIITR